MTAKERHEKHRKTEKFIANRKRYMKAYRASPRGREVIRRSWQKYNSDPAKRAARKAKKDKYRQTARYRAAYLKQFLNKRYGLTVAAYEKMLCDQDRVCAICFGENPRGQGLFVDHDHTTKAVRALLCNSCNVMLGRAKENVAVLRRAAEYLEKHSKERP